MAMPALLRSGLMAITRRAVGGLSRGWRLCGCRQLSHGMALLLLVALTVMAWELGRISQALTTVAQAQAISGFAVMRSLQQPSAVRAHATASPAISASDPQAFAHPPSRPGR